MKILGWIRVLAIPGVPFSGFGFGSWGWAGLRCWLRGGWGFAMGIWIRGVFGMGFVWVWVRGVLGGFWGGGKLGVEGRGNLRG